MSSSIPLPYSPQSLIHSYVEWKCDESSLSLKYADMKRLNIQLLALSL